MREVEPRHVLIEAPADFSSVLSVLLDKALRVRYGDETLRYAYPLASWTVEQSSDPTQTMITLSTVDGFSVCFSMLHAQQNKLGEALVAKYVPKVLRTH